VSGADLVALEPALAPDLAACRLAIGYPVEPAAATRAFAARAAAAGAQIEMGEGVGLAVEGDHVVGVLAGGRLQPAARVVVAAGPWTPQVVDPSGRWEPIRPIWGVVASIALVDAPRHGLEAIDIDIEPGGEGPNGDGDGPAADAGVDF